MTNDLIFEMNSIRSWIPTLEEFKELLSYLENECNVELNSLTNDDWDSIEDLLVNRRKNIEKHNYNLFHVWVGDNILITIVKRTKDSCVGVVKFINE